MIPLNVIMKYLKFKDDKFAAYYIGKLNNKKDKSLGIYNLNRDVAGGGIAVGGRENTKIEVKNISLLVHGSNNKTETEQMAFNLYQILENVRNEKIDDFNINYIKMLYNEPIDVYIDTNGIYEYVIDIQINYTKER